MPRSKIATPWPPRDLTEPTLLYRVRGWRVLSRAIRNIERQRVSQSRWSTRLAVERASTLAQIFLESPLEWALHDALLAEGIGFRVMADEVRPVSPIPTRGRARFVLNDERIVSYAGANGFEVRSVGAVRLFSTVQRTAAFLAAHGDGKPDLNAV